MSKTEPEVQSDLLRSIVSQNTSLSGQVTSVDTVVDAIKLKTDNLPSDPADQSAVEAAVTVATLKIDGAAVSGLSGVADSLAYKVHEIEKHIHNSDQWFGKDSEDDLLNRNSLTPWVLVAGDSQAYGSEIQLSDGTEVESGSTTKKFDLHEVLIVANDAINAVTTFKIQFWYGTGLFAAATLLTESVASFYAVSDNHGIIQIRAPRITCNNKLWARIACSVNGKSISILIGLHTYTA